MSNIAIIEAFEGMPDYRDNQGKRHSLPLSVDHKVIARQAIAIN
jgi:hypothetical protein